MYNKPRTYGLHTPNRKKLTKLLVRGNPASVVAHVMKDTRYSSLLFVKMGQTIGKEITFMCSDKAASFLGNGELKNLMSFNWKNVINEVSQFAPNLLLVLNSCFKTINTKKSCIQLIGLIYSATFVEEL